MATDPIQDDNYDIQVTQNKIKVLQLIRSKNEITRAEIIQLSGLSAPTVTRIVENLCQLNLIKTDGVGVSIGGRRPQIIKFQSKDNYVIGIDLGATFIRAALSNLDGEFVFEIQVPTYLIKGFDIVMAQVGEIIQKLNERAIQNNFRVWGIGIAVCGMVNKNTSIVEYSPIFGWKNVNIQEALLKYTKLNIALGNVTHLIALGELLYGVGKEYSNFICLNVGYGIGSGIIIDRKIFGGADGIAGEVGHIIIEKCSQRKGFEGLSGSLEALASGYGVADIARERSKYELSSVLHALKSDDIDARCVFEAAKNGDLLANEIIDLVADYLSIGTDILIKLFNTECIVLSGGLFENGNMLISKMSAEVEKYSMGATNRVVPLFPSSFGANAAIMGSFSLILEKILSLERIET